MRAAFIADPNGMVRAACTNPQGLGRNANEVLRALKVLQVADKYGVALPANWPNNEVVGEHAIVPPAETVQEAEERPKKYECFDWWFCHREAPREEAEEARRFLERAAKRPA